MNLTKFTAKIVYIKNGQKVTTAGDDIVAIKDVKVENSILKASIASTQKIELFSVSLVYDRTMKDEELFYVNGYQSWTTSKEYRKSDVQKGLSWMCANLPLGRKLTACYGDYDFTTYSKDLFHSFTYFSSCLSSFKFFIRLLLSQKIDYLNYFLSCHFCKISILTA